MGSDHLPMIAKLEINGDIERGKQRRHCLYKKRNVLNYNTLIDKNLKTE